MFFGFMLSLDDGTRTMIQCSYERVHKLYTRCGLIGHTRGQCNENLAEVERLLIRQRNRIQRFHHVQYGFDSIEPQFHNELRAYFNRRRRWTTTARGGDMRQEHQFQQQQASDQHGPDNVDPQQGTEQHQQHPHHAAPN